MKNRNITIRKRTVNGTIREKHTGSKVITRLEYIDLKDHFLLYNQNFKILGKEYQITKNKGFCIKRFQMHYAKHLSYDYHLRVFFPF